MYKLRNIVGRTLEVYDSSSANMTKNNEPREILQYDIHPRAEILLNGQKVKLAELQIGDDVTIGNTSKEGYKYVEAVRGDDVIQEQRTTNLQPRVLRLQEDEVTTERTTEKQSKMVPERREHEPTSPGSPRVLVDTSLAMQDPNKADPESRDTDEKSQNDGQGGETSEGSSTAKPPRQEAKSTGKKH